MITRFQWIATIELDDECLKCAQAANTELLEIEINDHKNQSSAYRLKAICQSDARSGPKKGRRHSASEARGSPGVVIC